MAWKALNIFLLEPLKKIFIKFVKGLSNIPEPPFIIVSNHASYLDSFIIAKIMYDRFHQKTYYIAKPGLWRHILTESLLINFLGCIPIDLPNEGMFYVVKQKLKNKELVGIFPEGERTSNKKIKRFKSGIGRMAIESGVPVLPIALKWTYWIWPRHMLLPKIEKRVQVIIGKPVKFDRYINSYKSYEKIALSLEKRVNKLSSSLK